MSVAELKQFKSEMNTLGINVIVDKKGSILPPGVEGGFDYNIGQIVLKSSEPKGGNPTYLSALHESYHAKQWLEIGKEKYKALPVLEREEYVYNQIMMNKDKFNDVEILFSQRYIFRVRYGQWPPSDWKGFE